MADTDDRRHDSVIPPSEPMPSAPHYRAALDRPGGRARAWFHLLVTDHGLLRLAYLNAHRVGPRVWRAAQPSPFDLARFARRGVRTVLSIRAGLQLPGLDLEREACERLGVTLVELKIRGRVAPARAAIQDLIATLRTAEYPVLIHCKSGADRTGLVAAVYLLAIERRPFAEARAQLSLRFGHFRGSLAGILDAFFDAFGRDGDAAGLDFETWLAERYDPVRLTADFRARPWVTWFADTIMRREY